LAGLQIDDEGVACQLQNLLFVFNMLHLVELDQTALPEALNSAWLTVLAAGKPHLAEGASADKPHFLVVTELP
jgi:hypothetical protein